jgi:SAM-dependent methyltransferase
LVRHFARHRVRGQRALVVGCGRGHEARLLAAAGAEVVAVDFAPLALAEARALTPPELAIDYRERDLFHLGEDPDRYQLVVEHCCFCAIEPARRDDYVQAVAEVLVPGGLLVGLFRNPGRPGGPPYAVDLAELEQRFGGRFEVVALTAVSDSVAERQGQEMLGVFRRR